MTAFFLALATAWADPCVDAAADPVDGFGAGPVLAPMRDGGLGAARRVCTTSEIGVGVIGRATIDLDNFYGYLPGGLTIDGAATTGRGFEVYGQLEAVRVDMAIASISHMALGLGHLKLGVGWYTPTSERLAFGAHLGTVLPTATALYGRNPTLGLDLGIGLDWLAVRTLHLHGNLVHMVAFGTGLGPRLPEGGSDATVGLEWRPVKVFGLVVDLNAGFSTWHGVDFIAPAFALRFGDGRRFGFELGARLPVYGETPELAALALRASASLGRRP